MHYYIYRITNKVNGKIYIGAHQSLEKVDDYMGSGKLIKAAIKKYGKDSFVKEVIETFADRDTMFEREAILVTEEFCKLSSNYNLAPGGSGGSILSNRKPFTGPHKESTKQRLSEMYTGRKLSADHRKAISDNHWSVRDPDAQRKHAAQAPAKVRDADTRNKISKGMQGKINNPNGRLISVVSCPHCDKIGSEMAMKRWHFDKCKHASLVK